MPEIEYLYKVEVSKSKDISALSFKIKLQVNQYVFRMFLVAVFAMFTAHAFRLRIVLQNYLSGNLKFRS